MTRFPSPRLTTIFSYRTRSGIIVLLGEKIIVASFFPQRQSLPSQVPDLRPFFR